MLRSRILLLCFVVCAAAACKSQLPATLGSAAAVDAKPASAARVDNCPVRVPATTVTVMNTKDGVAMYFTTLGSYVTEVRRRTAALAQAVEPAADRRGVEVSSREIVGLAGMVPLRVSSEDISDGSRLVLVPVDPDDVDSLRSYARAQGERMRLGGCAPDFLKGRPKAASQQVPSPDAHG